MRTGSVVVERAGPATVLVELDPERALGGGEKIEDRLDAKLGAVASSWRSAASGYPWRMGLEPALGDLVRAVKSQRPDAGPLERLAVAADVSARLRERADELVDHFVRASRAAGFSWAEIGRALGVTTQAAQQRFLAASAEPDAPWPDGLDAPARAAFATAAREARELGHHYLTPEHVVLGLLAQREELAARALAQLGVAPDAVRAEILKHLGTAAPRPAGSLGMAPETKRLLELARTLSKRLGHRCARTEHLLLAAVSPALDSPARATLADCGADAPRVCHQLAAVLEIEAPELAARLRPARRRLRRHGRTRS